MNLKGIDVSEHQGIINWNEVKPQIDYAILRVGYGDNIESQDDKQFIRNADECTRLGIPFGVYIYSYAMSTDQAKSEAEHVLRLIEGYKLDYPVYYDLEDSNTTGLCSNSLIADMAEVFCTIVRAANYSVGIYANTSWFNNKLTDSRFSRWTKWVAQYANSCTYKGSYDMWQYASDGHVNGINSNVDMNYCYKVVSIAKGTIAAREKENIDVVYQTYTDGRWLSNVKNLENYAGLYGEPVQAIYANSNKGRLKYRVHTINGTWLPWVIDREDYAGVYDKNIDGVQMQLLDLNNYSVKYRAYVSGRWLSWVNDLADYAGIYGQAIEGIQVQIINK